MGCSFAVSKIEVFFGDFSNLFKTSLSLKKENERQRCAYANLLAAALAASSRASPLSACTADAMV